MIKLNFISNINCHREQSTSLSKLYGINEVKYYFKVVNTVLSLNIIVAILYYISMYGSKGGGGRPQ